MNPPETTITLKAADIDQLVQDVANLRQMHTDLEVKIAACMELSRSLANKLSVALEKPPSPVTQEN